MDLSSSKSLKNGCRFVWDGLTIGSDQIKDGEVLKLTFMIKRSANKGKYPIALVFDNDGIIDNNLNSINMEVDYGYLTIQ